MPPRAADSQSDSEILISDPSQFVPREDDDQTLYKVIEITEEKNGQYKVRWEGDDPKTMKPWAQSWVNKRDCTEDLVRAWKKKKKEKERRNSKKNGRDSASSKRASRSVASTKSRSESIATINTKRRNEQSSAGPSNIESKPKHRLKEVAVKDEDESEGTEELDVVLGQQPSASVGRSNVIRPNPPPSDIQPKGMKRKLAEAQSANSSANNTSSRRIEAVPIEVDSDEGQTTRMAEVIFSNPPRKKRRITSEERHPAQTLLIHQGGKKDHGVRNGREVRPPVTANDEQEGEGANVAIVKERSDAHEEEGIVEVLSDGDHSASMNNPDDMSRNNGDKVDPQDGNVDGDKQRTNKGKGKMVHVPQAKDEEDSDEVEIVESSDLARRPAQSNTTSIVRLPPKSPSARMTVQPPPNGRQMAATVPNLGSKAVDTTRPAATTKKFKDSSIVVKSNANHREPLFEPDSDSDRSPPPERHRKPQPPKPAKPPRSAVTVRIPADPDGEATLSPRTRRRLAIFDAEVMGKPSRVKKKRAKEVIGRGEGATSKHSSSLGNSRPAISAVRPNPRFDATMDVVPETELENSQENKLPSPSIAAKSYEQRNPVPDVSPIDSSTSIAKPLRPIPHISPSTFHPHLQAPESSLPDTIIEPSSSHDRRAETDAIEQFESPEKGRFPLTKTVVFLNKNGVVPEARKEHDSEPTTNRRGSAVEVSESVRRGQEIVEATRRRVSASNGVEPSAGATKRQSVQAVIARAQLRTLSEGNASQPDKDEDEDEKEQGEEEGVANASTSVVPPASGPPALSQDQLPHVYELPRPMEDDSVLNEDVYVSETEEVDKPHDDVDETSAGINPELSRREGEEGIHPELLRQEEEESTQDIMAEAEGKLLRCSLLEKLNRHIEEAERREIEGWGLGPPPLFAPPSRIGSINGDTGRPAALVSAEEPKLSNRPSPSRSVQNANQDDYAPRGPTTRSRSRSKTPSVLPALTKNRHNARGKKKPLSIPSPVPSRRESIEPESEPLKSPVDVFQNAQGSSTTSSILAAQISSLQSQVHGKQLEIDTLQQDLDSLREQLKGSGKALLEDRQRMTELQSQWANEKSAWEDERTLLAARTATSEESKIQAEQDREFVREQYAKASGYVTTIREENKELQQRVEVAEGQSKTGVELIKATFELRVAKLQDEAKAWRKMAEFVIEKDTRTNDDIRKRAAEQPELRKLCVRLKKELKDAGAKVDGLQADLQEKSGLCDASRAELEYCKRENARLHSDLNEALIKLDRIGRSGDESSQGNDHEFVYRCMWRVEMDNTQSVCSEVFAAMRELEQHIYLGHLAQH